MDTPVKSAVSSKGVKGAKQKPPLESVISREICEALQARGIFFWRSNNIPSLGRFGVDGAPRFRALPKFTPKGVADILCVHNGRFLALEVKRPGIKLRPEQAEWGAKLVMSGGIYAKVCTIEEAMYAIDSVESM